MFRCSGPPFLLRGFLPLLTTLGALLCLMPGLPLFCFFFGLLLLLVVPCGFRFLRACVAAVLGAGGAGGNGGEVGLGAGGGYRAAMRGGWPPCFLFYLRSG